MQINATYTEFSAVVYNNGQQIINQIKKIKNGYTQYKSKSPENSNSDVNPMAGCEPFGASNIVVRAINIDCVINLAPRGKAVQWSNWSQYQKHLNKNILRMKETVEADECVKTVDVYGVVDCGIRKFIFRKVTGKEAESVRKKLNEELPTCDELTACMNEVQELTQYPQYPGRAVWKTISVIAFYYLQVGKKLKVTIEAERIKTIRAINKPIIFIYPALIGVEEEKIRTIVNLVKQQYEPMITVFFIEIHPLEIDQPATISSFLENPRF